MPAMKKGYSKVLMNEVVIKEVGADGIAMGLGVIMMADFASRERTEGMWRAILGERGFWERCGGEGY
jgi:hypothetical protein